MPTKWLLALLALPAMGQQSTVIQDVSDRPPPALARKHDGLEWTERLERIQKSSKCGFPEAACTDILLVVGNPGDKFMKCGGFIKFNQPNPHGVGDATGDEVLIYPNSEVVVAQAMAPGSLPFSKDSQCISAEAPPPPPSPAPSPPTTAIVECSYRFTQAPNIDDFYPPDARAAMRQGRVYLKFTLPQPEGAATHIAVFQSSSHADIDAAGIKALASARFKTNCEGRSYRAAIRFFIK